jgi:hypothetical protein
MIPVGLFFWFVAGSEVFQSCLIQSSQLLQEGGPQVSFIGGYRDCIGKFLSKEHGAVTALATLAIALFAFTLWRAGERQMEMTRILQRAYLSVEPGGIVPFKSGDDLACDFLIHNVGHLPATQV